MYQSVMAKRVATGSSGTGFAFAVVRVKETHPDRDLCIVEDLNTGNQQDLSMTKRGETAWPQVGDLWVIDRSAGHWMLQIKVTDAKPPDMTGVYSTMDPDLFRLVSILSGLGLVTDATTSGTVPAVTGSKNVITPAVQSILSILDARGILDDQTTAQTVAVGTWQTLSMTTGWTAYAANATPQYMLNYDSTVTVEGRMVPPGAVTNGATIATLPLNFRPPGPRNSTVIVANGVCGNLIAGNDGTLKLWDFGAATVVSVPLHMRFSTVA